MKGIKICIYLALRKGYGRGNNVQKCTKTNCNIILNLLKHIVQENTLHVVKTNVNADKMSKLISK